MVYYDCTLLNMRKLTFELDHQCIHRWIALVKETGVTVQDGDLQEMGDRITSREMRDVRYGLVRHGLLLLPNEVVGDFVAGSKTSADDDFSDDDNQAKEYPLSLLDSMLNSVRSLSGPETSKRPLDSSNLKEASVVEEERQELLNGFTKTKIHSSSQNRTVAAAANNAAAAPPADVRIVLFAVLQGIKNIECVFFMF